MQSLEKSIPTKTFVEWLEAVQNVRETMEDIEESVLLGANGSALPTAQRRVDGRRELGEISGTEDIGQGLQRTTRDISQYLDLLKPSNTAFFRRGMFDHASPDSIEQ